VVLPDSTTSPPRVSVKRQSVTVKRNRDTTRPTGRGAQVIF